MNVGQVARYAAAGTAIAVGSAALFNRTFDNGVERGDDSAKTLFKYVGPAMVGLGAALLVTAAKGAFRPPIFGHDTTSARIVGTMSIGIGAGSAVAALRD
jgi:hypothetical protein